MDATPAERESTDPRPTAQPPSFVGEETPVDPRAIPMENAPDLEMSDAAYTAIAGVR